MRKQADVIARVAFEREHARILVLACGSAPDLRSLLPQLGRTSASFVLADMDDEALALHDAISSRSCRPFTTCRPTSSPASISCVDFGPFNLVVAGGLFDYLPDRAATILLRRVFGRLLAADGGMLFTNIATGNPYRCWIEDMGAWKLIERTDDQIHALLDAAGLAHVPGAPLARRHRAGAARRARLAGRAAARCRVDTSSLACGDRPAG